MGKIVIVFYVLLIIFNNKNMAYSDDLSDIEMLLEYDSFDELPIEFSDLRRNFNVFGLYTTSDDPLMGASLPSSSENRLGCSSCPAVFQINQDYEFTTDTPVFLGITIMNITDIERCANIRFWIIGRNDNHRKVLYASDDKEVSILPNNICRPFIDIPVNIPEGTYKLIGHVRGGGFASMKILFKDM